MIVLKFSIDYYDYYKGAFHFIVDHGLKIALNGAHSCLSPVKNAYHHIHILQVKHKLYYTYGYLKPVKRFSSSDIDTCTSFYCAA